MSCSRSGSLILSCVFKMLAMKDEEVETTHAELNNILQTNRDSVSANVILEPAEKVAATFGNVLGVIFCVNWSSMVTVFLTQCDFCCKFSLTSSYYVTSSDIFLRYLFLQTMTPVRLRPVLTTPHVMICSVVLFVNVSEDSMGPHVSRK